MGEDEFEWITDDLAEAVGENAKVVDETFNELQEWMRSVGKNPNRKKPLSDGLTENYIHRLDQALRFIIDLLDPAEKTNITHDQADLFVKALDEDKLTQRGGSAYSETSKRKFSNALQKYFEWTYHEKGAKDKWEPPIKFSDNDYQSADKLNFEERGKIRQVAREYGSLPSYYDTSPEQRDRLSGIVAQRLGIPKDDVTKKDWERADTSTKIGSLVAVSLETGLIPIEIQNARVDWYNPSKNVLVISQEDAGKDRLTAELPLTGETGDLLTRWIKERRFYEKYDDTDRLWLNREGNPYNSKNLCYLLRQLCEEAGIDHENRKIVWYSLRHNMGQSIEEEEDLSEAHDQLRHKNFESTKIYAESSIESRRSTLERVNQTARKAANDPNFDPYDDEKPRYPDEATTNETSNGSSGSLHVDATIEDTNDARMELIRKILSRNL